MELDPDPDPVPLVRGTYGSGSAPKCARDDVVIDEYGTFYILRDKFKIRILLSIRLDPILKLD
jgi:hypothetical protein